MGGDGDRVGALQAALQLIGEEQVGQLGLTVRADPAVAVLPLQVVEADSVAREAMTHAADRHDPRTWRGQHAVEQQVGEREVAQMIGAELQFEAVLGGLLRREHHTGVVDQQIDAVVPGLQFVGGGADRLQRRQVELLQRHAGARVGPGDQVGRGLALLDVAYGEHDVRALRGERRRGLIAKAGVGAGDDRGAVGLVGNVGGCPLGHANLLFWVSVVGQPTGDRTWVSSSDTVHSRRCAAKSWDAALDATTFG